MYEKPFLQNVPLEPFMDKFLSLTREDFKSKGIEIIMTVDNGAPACYADPRALQQVLLNLLTNAADALDGCKNPKVTITILKLDDRIQIRLEDNGCGIPEDRLKNLFKPFYTTKPKGTGLGLVIVKKMLTQMHGTIDITSQKDIGSVVDIYLPSSKEGTAAT